MSYILLLCCSWFDPAWLSLSAVFAPKSCMVRATTTQLSLDVDRASGMGRETKKRRHSTEHTLEQCIIDPWGGSLPYTSGI
jgi:hypothetical protein